MAMMNAAVVTSFGEPPHYEQVEVPQPNAADEFIVDVLAVGLHPRVRSGAAGAHYTSSGTLPMIPGIDAVGQRSDGRRIYFVAADDVIGTMADKALASARRSIVLPDDADVAKVAAASGVWVAEITAGTIAVKATMMPLADVEQIWPRAEVPGERTVLVP